MFIFRLFHFIFYYYIISQQALKVKRLYNFFKVKTHKKHISESYC